MNQLNYKNKLQEYCQKHKYPLPEYNDIPSLKVPGWSTLLYVNGKKYSGNGESKKIAQQVAARDAITDIEANLTNERNLIKTQIITRDSCILVDAENIDVNDHILSTLDPIPVILFAAKNTTKKINQYPSTHKNCKVFLSDSIGKNAADFYLTWMLGIMFNEYPNRFYYVVTKDCFGQHLEKFSNTFRHVCSFEELWRVL